MCLFCLVFFVIYLEDDSCSIGSRFWWRWLSLNSYLWPILKCLIRRSIDYSGRSCGSFLFISGRYSEACYWGWCCGTTLGCRLACCWFMSWWAASSNQLPWLLSESCACKEVIARSHSYFLTCSSCACTLFMKSLSIPNSLARRFSALSKKTNARPELICRAFSLSIYVQLASCRANRVTEVFD